MPEDERIRYSREDHWLGYPAAHAALNAMTDLVRRPRTTTSPSMLLLGRPGNGKTTILERFASQFPVRTRANGDLARDAIFMSMPAAATEKELWCELLAACDASRRVTNSAALLRDQAFDVLETLEPRVLVCDEVNNLLLGSGIAQRVVLARFRELTNRFKFHLILAGTEDAQRAADNDPQLDRRLERFELPRWAANMEFRRLLQSLERTMPLPSPSNLAGPELATIIALRTNGTIGSIVRLVKEATVLTIKAKRDAIDLEILQLVRVETTEERQRRARSL